MNTDTHRSEEDSWSDLCSSVFICGYSYRTSRHGAGRLAEAALKLGDAGREATQGQLEALEGGPACGRPLGEPLGQWAREQLRQQRLLALARLLALGVDDLLAEHLDQVVR